MAPLRVQVIDKIHIQGLTPHTTNKLWFPIGWGKRRTDQNYAKWKKDISTHLRANFCPSDMSEHGLGIEVGVACEFDLDNTLKAVIDALQEKYGFNDNQLGYLYARKYVTGSYEDGTQDHKHDFIDISLLEMVELKDNEIRPIPPWDPMRVREWRAGIVKSEDS